MAKKTDVETVYCNFHKREHKVTTGRYKVCLRKGYIEGKAKPAKESKKIREQKDTSGKEYCNECKRYHKVNTKRYEAHLRKGWIKGKEEQGVIVSKKPKQVKVLLHQKRRITSEYLKKLIKESKPEKWNWCVVCGKTDPKSGMSKETDEPYCADCYGLVKKARGEGKRIFKELGTDIDVDDYPVTDIEPEPSEELVEEQDKPKRKRKSSKRKK